MGLGLKGGMGPEARMGLKERLLLRLRLRLVTFRNDCHLPGGSPDGGRFCKAGPGGRIHGMTEKEWVAKKIKIASERKLDSNKAQGTEIFSGNHANNKTYRGPGVVVDFRAGKWMTEAELLGTQTSWERKNRRTGKVEQKTGNLAEYIRDNLKGYAVARMVGGERRYLSPLREHTDHGVYRALHFDMDVLFQTSTGAAGSEFGGKRFVENMVETVQPLTTEIRSGKTAGGTRAGAANFPVRVYSFSDSADGFAVSVVVNPHTGKVGTIGVEYPEGKRVDRPDMKILRDRVVEYKKSKGIPSRTEIVDVAELIGPPSKGR